MIRVMPWLAALFVLVGCESGPPMMIPVTDPSPIDGSYRMDVTNPPTDVDICLRIAGGKVVFFDEGCSGTSTSVLENAAADIDGDRVRVGFLAVAFDSSVAFEFDIDVEIQDDGSMVGTITGRNRDTGVAAVNEIILTPS
jgi:hypothetical protein